MRTSVVLWACGLPLLGALGACSGSESTPPTTSGGGSGLAGANGLGGGAGGTGGGSASGGVGVGGGLSGGGGVGTGGAAGSGGSGSVTYGRWGTPELTHTLTKPAGVLPRLRHDDVVKEIGGVDWSKLDRLYIPAGEYGSIYLGGLPERSPDRPLVITNLGGQVKVGGGGFGYALNLQGGKNWVLSGRYDPTSKTGDAAFRGHAEGSFAHSQRTYGIFIDDAFSKEGLSGLYVGSRASDFEIELVEIARVEFAGISAKTDNVGDAVMRNVKLHDTYIHDTGSEGIYFGSTQAQPQHAFEGLQIYDNRFLRTGTEALQTGQLGDGCEIHHNVLGPAAVRWRSAFQDYQDGNVQLGQRYGSTSFHHNVVIGTGDLFVEFFPTAVAGDTHGPTDTVTFSDNYFADTSAAGVYTHATANSVTVRFERNAFLGFWEDYAQVYPAAAKPVAVFGVGANTVNPHVLSDNAADSPYPFIKWLFPSVTQTNNAAKKLPRLAFRDFMTPELDANYRKLEWWTPVVTRHPATPARAYVAGDLVVHLGVLYRAKAASTNKAPDSNAALWEPLPEPADDVRVVGPGAVGGPAYPGLTGSVGLR